MKRFNDKSDSMKKSDITKKVDDGTEFFRRIHVIFMNILNNKGRATSNDGNTRPPSENNITQRTVALYDCESYAMLFVLCSNFVVIQLLHLLKNWAI